MAWLFQIWMLMFWLPAVASAAMGWFAIERGIIRRPASMTLWCLMACLLQFASPPLSIAWTAGLLAQSALAVYLSMRLKLETGNGMVRRHFHRK
jgi:surface polysaccharide O-acyltransferase-like enzyme